MPSQGKLNQLANGEYIWRNPRGSIHRFAANGMPINNVHGTPSVNSTRRDGDGHKDRRNNKESRSSNECSSAHSASSPNPAPDTQHSDTQASDYSGVTSDGSGDHDNSDTQTSPGDIPLIESNGDVTDQSAPATPQTQAGNTDENSASQSDGSEAIDNSDNSDNSDKNQCDVDSAGAHRFEPLINTGVHIELDARPASCESYFVDYYGTKRGSEIEAGLLNYPPYNSMTPTLRTFPIIDFISDTELIVVNSRDLGSRTYNSETNPTALLDRLLKDGEQIQTRFLDVLERDGSITASELGQSTTINADELKPITMQLVIRDGIASASHWQQIETARQILMARHGVELEVVVIP